VGSHAEIIWCVCFFPFSLSLGSLKMGVRPSVCVFVFASHVSCAVGRYGMQNAFSRVMIQRAGKREGSNW
jgi:hypothetical protein